MHVKTRLSQPILSKIVDRRSTYTELHGQTDLRLEIMKYILNVINILVYINSASNNTSSASVMLVV